MFADMPTGIFHGDGIKKTAIKATERATLITITSVRLRRSGPIAIRFLVIIATSEVDKDNQGDEAERQDYQKEPIHISSLRDNEQQQSDNRHCACCYCVRPMAERRYKSEVNRVAYCFATVQEAVQYC